MRQRDPEHDPATIEAINQLNDGRGFGVGATEAERLFFRLNFTWRVFAYGTWATDGRSISRALFSSCMYVVNMGSACPSPDSVFIEQAQLAKEAGAIAVTNRGPPEILRQAQNDHFFSIHVSSDEYPTRMIKQYELRGIKTVAVVGESADDLFFRGVTASAVRQVNESLQLDLVVHAQFEKDDLPAVRAGVRAAIADRADVLIFSGRDDEWSALLDLTYDAREEHVFKSIWATNVPYCSRYGHGRKCGHVFGANQMHEEEHYFTDALLGVSATVSTRRRPHRHPRGHLGVVQAVQTVFEFRGFRAHRFPRNAGRGEARARVHALGATSARRSTGRCRLTSTVRTRARANDAAGVTFRHRRDRLPERASDGGYRSPVARILRLRRLFLQEARDTKLLSVRRGMLAMSRQLVVRLHVSAEHVPG